MKDTASLRCARIAAVDPLDAAGREAAARELLGGAGPELDIQSGFHCDNGRNIRVGKRFTANFNVTILDGAPVTFGDYCMVGSGTLIATTGHPMDPRGRRDRLAISEPITVGDDLWIQGEPTITERKAMLDAKRAEFAARIAELEESVGCIDWKQGYYDSVLSGELPYTSNLIAAR